MSLAHLTPLPPQRTGVADATARLLVEVARQAEVVAYAPAGAAPLPGVQVRRASRLAMSRLHRHEAVVAQMGNSEAHAWILREVQRRPMIVELHDVVLHHLVAHLHFDPADGDRYEEAMALDAGPFGRIVARLALAGDLPGPWEMAAERFPLTGEAIANAKTVIVHSEFAARWLRERWPALDIRVVPHPHPPPDPAEPERLPARPFPLVGCFGFVTRQKRVPELMRAMVRVRERLPGAHLLVVGESVGQSPDMMAEGAGLPAEAITVVDYPPPERFAALMAGVDIAVNLRHPTMGETSGTAVRFLGLGIPVIVTTGGWYDEIPDAAVARIAPDEYEVATLAEAILGLAEDRPRRDAMGQAGREWIATDLAPEVIARRHLAATLGAVGRERLARELLADLGLRVAEVSSDDARRATGLPGHLAGAGHELGIL